MKRLFIIGNGFDIAHGIKTKFLDFGKYLELNQPNYYEALMQAFQNDTGLWKDFEATLPECGNYIVNSGFQMGEEIVDSLDYDPCDDMGIEDWLKDQYDFVEGLPVELRNWLATIRIDMPPVFHTLCNDDVFFSFNYTNTLEKIYNINEVLHIHGDLATNDCLIIGHGDVSVIKQIKKDLRNPSYKEYELASLQAEHFYLESTYKNTDEIISLHQQWFGNLSNVTDIYVIGFSFGKVDLPYIHKIHKSVQEAIWHLCYFEKETTCEIKRKKTILHEIGVPYSNIILQNQDSL